MLLLRNSPKVQKKKTFAKKPSKAAPSKPSAKLSKAFFKPAKPEEFLKRLQQNYPNAYCALHHKNAFELLVATILSAQCTDERVNMVTPALFEKFPDAKAMSRAKAEEIEDLIRSTGFFKNKSQSLLKMSKALIENHQGQVPKSLEQLIELAGVGRKTANVVMGNAFGIPTGVVVDTHVGRLSQRFAWAKIPDPVKIEKILCKIVPKDHWIQISHEMIFHGRKICKARNPQCADCFLKDICPKVGVGS